MPSSQFADYLRRNQRFAETGGMREVPEIPFIPFKQVYLITCVDPRVEPSAVLGVRLGEAIVTRNIGGRVTPSVVKDPRGSATCMRTRPRTPNGSRSRSCTTPTAAPPFSPTRGCAAATPPRGGYDERTAAAMAVLDPARTVVDDVAKLRSAPELAPGIENVAIGGYVYDLKTGAITIATHPSRATRAVERGLERRLGSPELSGES